MADVINLKAGYVLVDTIDDSIAPHPIGAVALARLGAVLRDLAPLDEAARRR
jgi:hypothetical protein